MHNRRQQPTLIPCVAKWRGTTKQRLSASVSLSAGVLALGLCIHLPSPASAQQSAIVDLTDPYVSVDLSVLNDGGTSPSMGLSSMGPSSMAPSRMGPSSPGTPTLGQISATGKMYTGSRPPGTVVPVSELYVKPSTRFNLPAQTKTIESTYAEAADTPSEQDVADTKRDEPADVAAISPAPAPREVDDVPAKPSTVPDAAEIADILPPPEAKEVAPVAPPPAAAIAAPVRAPKPTAEAKPAPKPAREEVAALTPPPSPTSPKPTPAPTVAVDSAPVAAPVEPAAPQTAPTPATEAPQNKPLALKTPPVEEAPAIPADKDKAADTAIPMPPQAAPRAETSHEMTMPLPPKVEVPVVAPVAEPTQAPAHVASLPSASQTLSDGDSLRVVFEPESSKLPPSARNELLEISKKLNDSETLRLQLLAYAGNADTSASAARRLSLSRALAVRSFLIENGVRSTRIDVRALGNKSTDAISERVDISVIER